VVRYFQKNRRQTTFNTHLRRHGGHVHCAHLSSNQAKRQMKRKHPKDCECCRDGVAAYLAKLEANIQKFGHTVIATEAEVNGYSIPMAYTVGLADAALKEMVVFGLPPQVALSVLNDAARRARAGTLPLDSAVDDICNFPVVFKLVEASAAAEYILAANQRAGHSLRAVQMVWPDKGGRFPWEVGFDPKLKDAQPVLAAAMN
jgi:hypothetical protein